MSTGQAGVTHQGQRPPKPPLAFRVGVVGHRPDRLQHASYPQLGEVIAQILRVVAEDVKEFSTRRPSLYSDEPILLKAFSPLAEGTDRVFADQALNLGWQLTVVMPFHQVEYEADFKPANQKKTDSLDDFHRLLSKASTCFELDGARSDESGAYAAAGEVVLNQSDLLIAVWDGDHSGKPGGTEAMLDHAKRKGIPTICITAKAPHVWRWHHPIGDSTGATIGRTVRGVLSVPGSAGAHKEDSCDDRHLHDLLRFYGERVPNRNWAVLWKAFRIAFGDWGVAQPQEEAPSADSSPPVADEAFAERLSGFKVWPDALAELYADRYRSAFLLVYLLAALAVFAALLPILVSLNETGQAICTSSEMTAILIVLLTVIGGRRRGWHERWIDYRFIAEQIRHLMLVADVGGERTFPPMPAHQAKYGHPSSTWMNWYVNGVARSVGLHSAIIDNAYLQRVLAQLELAIVEQRAYHAKNARRTRTIERRLQQGILGTLVVTLALCILHLVSKDGHMALIFWCGFLPAVGTALAAVNNQGEFRRLEKRSESMCSHLNTLRERIADLQNNMAALPEKSWARAVRQVAEYSAQLLVHEVLDWRVVFLDRPLEIET